jgi:hypothetical protein
MNTPSIKEIHEHLKHQTHKSTLNPEIPKHRANNPFVNLIFGTDLVHPKFRSQPRLLAQPNSTTGPSIRERKRERTYNQRTPCSKSSRRSIRLNLRTNPFTNPSSTHFGFFIILVSQTDSPQLPHEPALYHFGFLEPPISGFCFAFIKSSV